MELLYNNKVLSKLPQKTSILQIQKEVQLLLGIVDEDYYLSNNGKVLQGSSDVLQGKIHIVPRLVGGKGGFGSMLRAIGAQIEKTTNREACRDLSGRRLRDINEEQRLKNWIAAQVEREKEAAERKKKKLEKLCQEPKHEFKDDNYDKLRSDLPDKVEDAVVQGLKASCSGKRKQEEEKPKNKKKAKLWFDEEELSSTEDDSEDETRKAIDSNCILESTITLASEVQQDTSSAERS